MSEAGSSKKQAPARKRPQPSGGVKKTRFAPDTKRKKRDTDTHAPSDSKSSFKGIFVKDLGDMMFGYGDSSTNPVPETVDAVESIAVEFVKNIMTQCVNNSSIKGKIDVPDVQFVLRKDLPKAARAGELIIAKDRTKRFKNVGKMEDLDVETIEDALNVHETS
eukprot:jgi/Ulvmu1/5475/UM023_0011.1